MNVTFDSLPFDGYTTTLTTQIAGGNAPEKGVLLVPMSDRPRWGLEIIKLTGTDQKVVYHDLPVNDPKQRQPDITKARNILGWEPKVNRAEGLKHTYEYFLRLSPEELTQKDHNDFEKYIQR